MQRILLLLHSSVSLSTLTTSIHPHLPTREQRLCPSPVFIPIICYQRGELSYNGSWKKNTYQMVPWYCVTHSAGCKLLDRIYCQRGARAPSTGPVLALMYTESLFISFSRHFLALYSLWIIVLLLLRALSCLVGPFRISSGFWLASVSLSLRVNSNLFL